MEMIVDQNCLCLRQLNSLIYSFLFHCSSTTSPEKEINKLLKNITQPSTPLEVNEELGSGDNFSTDI